MEGKKRTTNFTPDEKRILSELVLKYRDSVENKKTDAATNTQKINAWISLANEFNSISTFCHRNYQSLKTCWDNIKRQSKKEKANIKKEVFKTGGGLPPQTQQNPIDSIVEAVLGPAVEGIPNCYDSDRTINNIIELEVNDTNSLDLLVLPSESNSQIERLNTPSAARVIIFDDDTKENVQSGHPKVDTPTTSGTDQSGTDQSRWPASTSISNDMESWTDWTPKTLKRPLTDCLRTVNKKGDKSVKRRRPVNENLQDEILREKVSLVKLLKQKAEEEANLRILILKEQLKQEQIKTENMLQK